MEKFFYFCRKTEKPLESSKSAMALIQGQDFKPLKQGFGSGSGLDPDSIRSVEPDPYSESGSGSRRAKMTHKSRKI
jgi:hypothetical protein